MSPAAKKLATVLALLAVAVAGFVALRPSDDEKVTSAAATPPAATTPQAPVSTTTTPAPTPAPKAVVIRTSGGAPISDVRKIIVDKGERVRIDVSSDIAEEVHVHGYDREFTIPAGGRAKLRFPATIDGRFEIELHGSGEPIGELTVNP